MEKFARFHDSDRRNFAAAATAGAFDPGRPEPVLYSAIRNVEGGVDFAIRDGSKTYHQRRPQPVEKAFGCRQCCSTCWRNRSWIRFWRRAKVGSRDLMCVDR